MGHIFLLLHMFNNFWLVIRHYQFNVVEFKIWLYFHKEYCFFLFWGFFFGILWHPKSYTTRTSLQKELTIHVQELLAPSGCSLGFEPSQGDPRESPPNDEYWEGTRGWPFLSMRTPLMNSLCFRGLRLIEPLSDLRNGLRLSLLSSLSFHMSIPWSEDFLFLISPFYLS